MNCFQSDCQFWYSIFSPQIPFAFQFLIFTFLFLLASVSSGSTYQDNCRSTIERFAFVRFWSKATKIGRLDGLTGLLETTFDWLFSFFLSFFLGGGGQDTNKKGKKIRKKERKVEMEKNDLKEGLNKKKKSGNSFSNDKLPVVASVYFHCNRNRDWYSLRTHDKLLHNGQHIVSHSPPPHFDQRPE